MVSDLYILDTTGVNPPMSSRLSPFATAAATASETFRRPR